MKFIAMMLACLLAAGAVQAREQTVGFTELRIADGEKAPLVIGVWYPSDGKAELRAVGSHQQSAVLDGPVSGEDLPLVVMSHGQGGSYDNHYDTALALAHAGFVVAAVNHTGDTYLDQSRALFLADRPIHIHTLIEYMLKLWPHHSQIDPRRVGVFGYSSGGFTALVSVGGIPDLKLIEAHAIAHPDYFDAGLVRRFGLADHTVAESLKVSTSDWIHDPRIKAAVIAAPALGYTFANGGLRNVTVPIQLWRAEDDHILPQPDYAEAVRIALPQPPEFHIVTNADHFDFLAPCSALLLQVAPQICVSRPGFDRTVFHQNFNSAVVLFFQSNLR